MLFFKQKTAYEVRISDWSSDVCSSDLRQREAERRALPRPAFGTDHSAVAFDDALDRRQADAVAVELFLVVQPLEGTEQLARVFRREARAVVGDVERQLLAGKDRKSTRLNSSH